MTKRNILLKLSSIRNHSDRIKFANKHLSKIGSGSSRIAYHWSKHRIIKIAKNDKGLIQNETEIRIFESTHSTKCRNKLAKVYDSCKLNYYWEIQEKVQYKLRESAMYKSVNGKTYNMLETISRHQKLLHGDVFRSCGRIKNGNIVLYDYGLTTLNYELYYNA